MNKPISNHTVGAHSDDRGGKADEPCYCDPKPITKDELRKAVYDELTKLILASGGNLGFGRFRKETTNAIMQKVDEYVAAVIAQSIIAELNKVPNHTSVNLHIRDRIKQLKTEAKL